MPKAYVEASATLLEGIDEMVREGFYHDRSEAVNDALRMLLKQYKLSKLHAKDFPSEKDSGFDRESLNRGLSSKEPESRSSGSGD